MKITDPIADLLTRIRNAQKAGLDVVSVPASKMKIAIVHLLKNEGFIRNYKCIRDKKQGVIKIALKYVDENKGVIKGLKRVSTSSCRVYVRSDKFPKIKAGFGVLVLSTSQGIMTDREARRRNIGGEYLCYVF